MAERLDQIKAILERTTQRAEANRGANAQLRSTVNSLLQIRHFAAIATEQREVAAEVKGLRTESQPTLKHLFSTQENG